MRALVSGATGFIGASLVEKLAETERPAVLTRDPESAGRAIGGVVSSAHPWEPEKGPPPAAALDGVDVVFHLAGETVNGRWNPEKKRRIHDSRAVGTAHLASAIANLPSASRPRALVCASGVGFYGDRGEDELDESAPNGSDFLAQVCRDWEQAADAAREAGVRVVHARIGVALATAGGALASMLGPFRMGVGGRLGSGRQWMPWIHRADVVGLLLHASVEEKLVGPMNTVSPAPARNADFTRALAKAVHRPAFLPMPGFMLKLAIGEFSSAVLGSQRALPKAALASGYAFRFPDLDGALAEALGGAKARSA
jgi:uncharacterized protein (TIGR01777 family)